MSLGYGTTGNNAVYAHEFAHIIQDGVIKALYPEKDEEEAAKSRRHELEADAMAGYYLAHDFGHNFIIPELVKKAGGFWGLGDCDAASAGHHGTPIQRECSAV